VIRRKSCWLLLPVLLVFGTAGCGTFMADRLAQSPNTYPTWFAPKAPVELDYSTKFLTNFPKQFVDVGPLTARLCFRIIEPADYDLKVSSTNWLEHDQKQFEFTFHADVPGRTNIWTSSPRGTVVLLHGYGLAQFSMVPWALRLGQEGWRCVLVDLRGHGKSTGERIYFGIQETHDLSQLLDALAKKGKLKEPVAAFGESYGAALSLRWKPVEPRIRAVVAITPYAGLSNTVLILRQEYASWLPKTLVNAGLNKLPSVLGTTASELDTTTVMARHPVTALFVAGAEDKIVLVKDVEQLRVMAAPGSDLIVVPDATHESVTYFFPVLVPPILTWLSGKGEPDHPPSQ
jgi:cephalosporin-C deacetylase-like acetyl esterase